MGLCFIEVLLMIVGSSVPAIFSKFNLNQSVVHFLGCLFTTWFILDVWQYSWIWVLWVFFSLVPFITESVMLQQAIKLNKDIKRNSLGVR